MQSSIHNATAALARMRMDEDIQQEALSSTASDQEFKNSEIADVAIPAARCPYASRLKIKDNPFTLMPGTGGHRSSGTSLRLLNEAGGMAALKVFTNRFYELAFQDPHLDQFIRDRKDPHGSRFAAWVAEKMGDGNPWSRERRSRVVCPFRSQGHQFSTPHDRSSAHYAAWHSPKRPARDFGKHFKLDDCRVWMRLHFLALRQSGIVERSPAFTDYYIRFIGHFVSIYERTATKFAREAFRWSASPGNVDAYIKNKRTMSDVIRLSSSQALAQLPRAEASDQAWPYPRYS